MKKGALLPYMKPGWIDLHTHGFGGYDTKTGNPAPILKMAALQGGAGTAAILPTIYPGPLEGMRKNIEAVRGAMAVQCSMWGPHGSMRNQSRASRDSLILGVHLEGPFLNPVRCGALHPESFLKPTVSALRKLTEGYEGIIKVVTIAPELPGALKVIEKCADMDIRVNMGHSDATYRQASEGRKAGATGITHIFNAMRPFHHREPGIAGFGLLDSDTYVEVIADGVHLQREVLKLLFRLKRPDRIMIVSDSVKGAGKRRSPLYKSGRLAGGGTALRESGELLRGLGISQSSLLKAGVENPERYLNHSKMRRGDDVRLHP